METKDDWYNVELTTQHAFWNKHHLGCDEHYLVHKLRQDKDYLPELSRIAVKRWSCNRMYNVFKGTGC
jgi:predicted N-acetyltransferase YhbS